MPKIVVALDLPDAAPALRLVERLGEAAEWYKVGAQLFTAAGPDMVRQLKDRGKKVFLDLKFHDIPSTVARAVQAARAVGVDMLTVHAAGGSTMLRAARDAAGADGPLLVAVTVLTSMAAPDLEEVWGRRPDSVREEVSRLAALAAAAGLDGVVASAGEVEAIKRQHGPGFRAVTPGIRPPGDDAADQVRTATPAEAARAGADYLVVGRSIVAAPDPVGVLARVSADIAAAEARA
ncbi:MAG TPA: orotidine-5'-phosphate decarboxylase [Longimicrobiales bacterium]